MAGFRFIFLISANLIIVATILLGHYDVVMGAEQKTDGREIHSDGRVVITIKETTLALPSSSQNISFTASSAGLKKPVKLSLNEVLSHADVARDLFSESEIVTIDIPDQISIQIPGFERSASMHLGLVFGKKSDANCKYWESRFHELRIAFKDTGSHDDSGWELAYKDTKSPASSSYIYIGADRSENIPGISCDALHSCYVARCVRPNVGFYYAFSERLPKSEWRALTEKANAIINAIFLDQNK